MQIQVEGPLGDRDSGLYPQPLTQGLSLLPRAGNKKPGQVHCSTELLSLQHMKEVMFNEEEIKIKKSSQILAEWRINFKSK